MRIIAGKNKSTKLFGFDIGDDGKRPTLDRVKESIFNTLQFQISGAHVLDLFAGTGNMGLEANSRGAKVTIVDNDKNSIKIIKKNIEKCHAQNEVTLINDDYKNAIEQFKKGSLFDIIFIDPPYMQNMGEDAILRSLEILADDGVIVYEHSVNVGFNLQGINYKSKKIGTVMLEYIKKC